MNSNRATWPVLLTFLLATFVPHADELWADACKDAVTAPPRDFVAACSATAITEPYKLAWLILARLCPLQSPTGNAAECEWPKWASFADTYPDDPDQRRPAWPTATSYPPPALSPSCKYGDRKRYAYYPSDNPCEKIYDFRLDRQAFDYVVKNDLWYQEGLAASWTQRAEIDFPPEATALQAAWKQIQADEKARYLWISLDEKSPTTGQPIVCGLTGLDVKSKILNDWFWLAFEHVDNPSRCDVIGCRDDFGQEPSIILPAPLSGKGYPAGRLTERLLELVPIGVTSVWRNYRLKGVQTSFTDAEGKPTLLGNSAPQLEGEFLPRAMSCMTCHSRASFDSKGEAMPGLPVVYGAPDPSWFFFDLAFSDVQYQQSNFIWSAALDACPKTSKPGN
ncbi:MAG: hypothetical protein HC897_04320 [Thermoanaerobaculia bacterium]|nr:hypothetical protein [Thermoanaerobaculia bacterium]